MTESDKLAAAEGYLGRVLVGGESAGTCFQVSAGVLVTAWDAIETCGADAVVVVTEWPEYVGLDWARVATLVRRRLVVDGRNCLSADPLVDLGFTYIGVGRPTRKPKAAKAQPPAGTRTPDLLAVR